MFKIITIPIEIMLPQFFWQKMIKRLPFKQIQYGSLTIVYQGQSYRFAGKYPGSHADLSISSMLRFLWLLKSQGELGVTQAYIEKTIDTPSLYQLMTFAHQNRETLEKLLENKKAVGWWHLWMHRRRHNSIKNSRRNISAHYDLGNRFYQLWLDRTMTYSSGIFLTHGDTLEKSQQQKYQRILDQLALKKGDQILEIGCGWGGFLEAASQKGAFVKGLTLSSEQKSYAEQRLKFAQLTANAQVALQDYRHEHKQYDHIVSIEMFEAVGKEYWHHYFEQLNKNLKTNGRAVLQVITIADEIAESYQNSVDFIQAYIFPGGLLPSLTQLKHLAQQHDLEWIDDYEFGLDYAQTLQKWLVQFNQQSHNLEELQYDTSFQRLWRYYLDYCRVGFEQKHISVYQITLSKPSIEADKS